jgi:hypothetical protein
MGRPLHILAAAALCLLLQPSGIASAAGSTSVSCNRALLGVGKCQVVRCVGRGCKSVVLPRGTAAKARITLNQCIRSYEACEANCYLGVQHKPPYSSYFKDCTNRCDANHSACVDFALTLSRSVQ